MCNMLLIKMTKKNNIIQGIFGLDDMQKWVTILRHTDFSACPRLLNLWNRFKHKTIYTVYIVE